MCIFVLSSFYLLLKIEVPPGSSFLSGGGL